MTSPLDASWIGVGALLVAGLIGLLALSVSPRSAARLTFAAAMLLLAAESTFALLSHHAPTPSRAIAWQHWRLGAIAFLPGIWLLFSVCYARRRPRAFSPLWKGTLGLVFVIPIALLLLPEGRVWGGALIGNGTGGVFELGRSAVWIHGFCVLVSVLALGNLEQTFRATRGVMRWRIKFLLLGVGILLVTQLYTSGWAAIDHSWSVSHDLTRSLSVMAAGGLILWSLARLGLSEAEVYPSRRVILGAATISLVSAYSVLMMGLARIAVRPERPAGFHLSMLVILSGALLLALALMSDRLRQRAILFFSRHFNRPLYDYRAIWQTFRERVALANGEHEYSRLSADFVSETLHAMSVTIWQIEPGRKLAFGGSTVLTRDTAMALLSEHAVSDDLLDGFLEQEGVLDLDDSENSWRDARGWLFASQFHEAGGHRLCVPLRVELEVVGLLLVGDRILAHPYSAEELDLLHTLAGEISRGLWNLRNARQLLIARELQAFQTLSAFVVHDLKNAVTRLSLTLQNFKRFQDNPAFREDALRSFSSCVAHMNEVISTLGVLRQDLQLKPLPSDLNALVHDVCAEIGGERCVSMDLQLGTIPALVFDPVQIKKVLTNLLLNARDAVGPSGHVGVATSMRDARRVELEVRDDGCGMDEEFMRTQMFRPFQSSKGKGLGIGLFHTRMILEAHRAEIEVESKPGKGTVFRVLLPLNGICP